MTVKSRILVEQPMRETNISTEMDAIKKREIEDFFIATSSLSMKEKKAADDLASTSDRRLHLVTISLEKVWLLRYNVNLTNK